MADLDLVIDRHQFARRQAVPAQRRLYQALRAAILDGRLQAGALLPASRVLAQDLGIARNTAIHAYEQLAAEGYVQTSRQGTVVSALSAVPEQPASPYKVPLIKPVADAAGPSHGLSQRVALHHRVRRPEQDLLPFMPGTPALDAFPSDTWRRLVERAQRQALPQDLGYRHAAGEPELRQAIATHLRAARGVRCQADQVIVTEGTQHSLDLCAHLLADAGERVWMEHPGYGGARTAFARAGLVQVPITVDAQGQQPMDDLWRRQPPRLVYATPSHQYPLGSVLSLPRRLALIEQANRHGAWILEDDYDSEFRHDGPPLAAMQGLVEDAPVVYLGTFSKSMFPGLRLGFIVMPAALADRAVGVVGDLVRQGRVAEQRALAAFIDEGHFALHLRRMRRLYASRQQALRDALARHWPIEGAVLGGQGGMHLVLSLPPEQPDVELAERALALGLSPRPLSFYVTPGGIGGFNGLVMGYAHVPEKDMAGHVRTLAGGLRKLAAQ